MTEDCEQTDPWPPCPEHREVQHRDGHPPWCQTCGWSRGRPAVEPHQVALPYISGMKQVGRVQGVLPPAER